MRTLVLIAFLAACGSKKPTGVQTPVEQDNAAETCCCKSTPIASEDAKPVYETGNRIECSSKQGDCVDEVQCQQQPQPE